MRTVIGGASRQKASTPQNKTKKQAHTHNEHKSMHTQQQVRTIISQEERLVIGGRAGAVEHLAQVKELPVNVSKLNTAEAYLANGGY